MPVIANNGADPVILDFRTPTLGTATRPPPIVYQFQLNLTSIGTRIVIPLLGRDRLSVTISEPGNSWGSGVVSLKGTNNPNGNSSTAGASPVTYTSANANTTVNVDTAVTMITAYAVFEVTTIEADVTVEFNVYAFSSV